ncbi:hypothetical protein AB2M62_10800 [Sphingomonas sp. MMS12-HWE2-04]|uniref:hypothetical protein n=1 Tax=Sphingomonas sp. MMS12-HWE2-04 TaxID=3234199 RepID=UPI00384BB7AD
MYRMLFATLALAAAATPAAASHDHVYRSHNTPAALKAGCTVSQVHVPSGKAIHTPAVIRCPAPVEALGGAETKRKQA